MASGDKQKIKAIQVMIENHDQAASQAMAAISGAKNSTELYLFYMRLILFPVKF